MVAKEAKSAEPLTEAVAPVKMRLGGCCSPVDLRRRGRVAWEKLKAPLLEGEGDDQYLFLSTHLIEQSAYRLPA